MVLLFILCFVSTVYISHMTILFAGGTSLEVHVSTTITVLAVTLLAQFTWRTRPLCAATVCVDVFLWPWSEKLVKQNEYWNDLIWQYSLPIIHGYFPPSEISSVPGKLWLNGEAKMKILSCKVQKAPFILDCECWVECWQIDLLYKRGSWDSTWAVMFVFMMT